MKKHNKLYQSYLHILLVKRRLNEYEYRVITTLTESEVKVCFTYSRMNINKIVNVLGDIVMYQALKCHAIDRSWLLNQKRLEQRQYLWSNTLGIELDPSRARSICSKQLGLMLLAQHNPRHAMMWSLRLGVSLSDSNLAVKFPARLGVLITQVAKGVRTK